MSEPKQDVEADLGINQSPIPKGPYKATFSVQEGEKGCDFCKTPLKEASGIVYCPSCMEKPVKGAGRIYYSKVEEPESKPEPAEVPMGVSQWRAYGIKYGYWDYFKIGDEKKEIAVRKPEPAEVECDESITSCCCHHTHVGTPPIECETLGKDCEHCQPQPSDWEKELDEELIELLNIFAITRKKKTPDTSVIFMKQKEVFKHFIRQLLQDREEQVRRECAEVVQELVDRLYSGADYIPIDEIKAKILHPEKNYE